MHSSQLTAAQVAELLAKQVGMTVEQARALLQAQAELAYQHASDGFPVPGIGVLTLVNRPERKVTLRFGPRCGEEIQLPAAHKLKFRIARIAQQMILESHGPMPDLFAHQATPDFAFSSEATQLANPSDFLPILGDSLTLVHDNSPASVVLYQLRDLWISSGKIIAGDFLVGGGRPFARTVPSGRYPLALALAQLEGNQPVALAIVRFSNARVARWEMAITDGQDISSLKEGEFFGYGVDSGTGSFFDASIKLVTDAWTDAGIEIGEQISGQLGPHGWLTIEWPSGSGAVFQSGFGDGHYPSYFGLDDAGDPVVLLTDFHIVNWRRRNS